MSGIEVEIVDERSITIPRGALNNAQTEQIGKFITNAAQDGYSLVSTRDKTRHDQREGQYTVGVTLSFRKRT